MAKKKKTSPQKKGTNKKSPSKRASNPKGKGTRPPKASKAHTSATKGKVTAKSGQQATPSKKAPRGNDNPAKSKRAGILEAAVRVLKEAKQPKRCAEIIEVMLKKNYWTTGGKTPAATLNSSMIREIRDKGAKSRFKKVERGLFGLNPKS